MLDFPSSFVEGAERTVLAFLAFLALLETDVAVAVVEAGSGADDLAVELAGAEAVVRVSVVTTGTFDGAGWIDSC